MPQTKTLPRTFLSKRPSFLQEPPNESPPQAAPPQARKLSIESTFSSSLAAPKRQVILNEILSTERQYVNDLKILIRLFLLPIRSQELMNKREIALVFGNIEALVPVNESILRDLEKRQREDGALVKFSDAFLSSINLFKLYAVYCSTNRKSTGILKTLRSSNPDLAKFISKTNNKRNLRGLHIEDLLIMPLQRLCKYPLLFENLIDATPRDHPDFHAAEEVCKLIKEIVQKINERTKEVENVEELSEIQQKYELGELGIDLVSRQRSVHQEAKVNIYKQEQQIKIPCAAILCSDQLLLLTLDPEEGNKVLLRSPIDLFTASHVGGNACRIDITHGKKVLTLEFSSQVEKSNWATSFKKAAEGFVRSPEEPAKLRKNSISRRIIGTLTSQSLGTVRRRSATARRAMFSQSSFAPQEGEQGEEPTRVRLASLSAVLSPTTSRDSGPPSIVNQSTQAKRRISMVKSKLQGCSSAEEQVEILLGLLEQEFLLNASLSSRLESVQVERPSSPSLGSLNIRKSPTVIRRMRGSAITHTRSGGANPPESPPVTLAYTLTEPDPQMKPRFEEKPAPATRSESEPTSDPLEPSPLPSSTSGTSSVTTPTGGRKRSVTIQECPSPSPPARKPEPKPLPVSQSAPAMSESTSMPEIKQEKRLSFPDPEPELEPEPILRTPPISNMSRVYRKSNRKSVHEVKQLFEQRMTPPGSRVSITALQRENELLQEERSELRGALLQVKALIEQEQSKEAALVIQQQQNLLSLVTKDLVAQRAQVFEDLSRRASLNSLQHRRSTSTGNTDTPLEAMQVKI